MDIDPIFFCTGWFMIPRTIYPKAIIITNLFGCAAELLMLRTWCDECGIVMIEDNAQAPYATIGGRYTGTIGHVGVFSLNVHKHLQCGEGGVVVTNEDDLALGLECAINHGELTETDINRIEFMGGNFRMTEPIAAIACAQLKRGRKLVQTRIDLAESITDIFRQVSFVEPPRARLAEVHSYYLWAGKITGSNSCDIRERFVTKLNEC